MPKSGALMSTHRNQTGSRRAGGGWLIAAVLLALTTTTIAGDVDLAGGAAAALGTSRAVVEPAAGGSAGDGGARELLAALPVRVEDTGAHYDRDDWGDWTTRKGCTTREQILIRDGHNVTAGAGCQITTGRWDSPYDGQTTTTTRAVQIDHRVPPAEAVRHGASSCPTVTSASGDPSSNAGSTPARRRPDGHEL
jgi:hypothetical protein